MDRDTEIDLEFILQTNYDLLTDQYGSYVTCVRDSLVSIQENQPRTIKSLRQHLLGLKARDSGDNVKLDERKLLSQLKLELEEANDIDDIIGVIAENCASYLNIWIFQNIVDQFHLDNRQEALNYPVFLTEYIEKHKISEIAKLPKFENFFGGCTNLTFKLNIDLVQRFSHLISIEKAIAKILSISPAAIIIKDIKKGCVVVTTCIPTFVAEDIFGHHKKFTQEEEEKFQSLSVLWLKCRHQTFEFKDSSCAKGT